MEHVTGDDPRAPEEEGSDSPWWEAGIESTLTIVLGATPHAVAHVLGLALEEFSPQMVLDVAWTQEGASPLSIVELEGATAVFEVNGFHTVQPHVAQSLSALGTTVCLYWNVNHVARFLVAEDGRLVRDFDPVIDEGGGLGQPFPEEDGIDWEESPIPQAAELQARLTGIRLSRGDLFGKPLPTTMKPW